MTGRSLGDSTELTVANNLNIGASGVLNQSGGIIDPAVVNNTGRVGGKGAISAGVSIVNTGTLFAANGTETLSTPLITGTGALEIVGSVAATQTVTFIDATGVLTIGTLDGFAATMGNFIAGDAIGVQGTSVAATGFDVSAHVLTRFDVSNAVEGTLQFGTSVTDGSAIAVNGVTPCFVAGTRISAERGEVPVEELRVGDRVQVVGLHGAQPIVWLGHRTLDCGRYPQPHKVWPVRVAAHAFGPGRPARDLFVSPDHALYLDDALIPAKHLINDITVAQVPAGKVTYYHIELPRHAVLLAEGLAAESYLDTGDRSNFANGGGAIALYPDFTSRVWEAQGCASLVVTGPKLQAARRWLAAVAKNAGRKVEDQAAGSRIRSVSASATP